MTVEYAPKGLVGVFTPQANTTVEPEMAILTPPGYAWINARMTSQRADISARLLDYMDQFPALLGQFANAPVDAVAIACTGSSYLLGIDREDVLLADIEERTGVPALTGASASVDALHLLGARRIALVSPYNSALDAQSAGYWTARGFEVVGEANAYRETDEFHAIYSLSADAALKAMRTFETKSIDAVLMLGTGMPTLRAISVLPSIGSAPVLSCMLCLAWRAISHLDPLLATREGLQAWLTHRPWETNLQRFST